MKKKLLLKLLENYQPHMYNHYTSDNIGDFTYLNEVADAILNLDKFAEQDKCPRCHESCWEYSRIHDSRRCLKCALVQTNL